MGSQALQVIDVPAELPKGVTKRQWRLAALLPRCETAAEAMRLAGYGPQTIDKQSRHQSGTVGVRRAREAQQQQLADKARGLIGVGTSGLVDAKADLMALDPRDRLAASLKFIEVGHSIGENVEATGDASAWKHRQRRAIRLALHLGFVAGRRTQDVVLSPDITSVAVANQRNDSTTELT